MPAPQILNLDDLTADKVDRIVRVGNEDHVAAEMTVEAYIARVKRARSIPDNAPAEDKLENAISILLETFPTMKSDQLRKMPLSHLGKIVQFSLEAPDDLPAPDPVPAVTPAAGAEGNV